MDGNDWGFSHCCYGSYCYLRSISVAEQTDKLRTKLTDGRQTIQPTVYNPKEIEGLPAPVQRFFQTVLQEGQAIVAAVNLSQQGQFNMNELRTSGVSLPPHSV